MIRPVYKVGRGYQRQIVTAEVIGSHRLVGLTIRRVHFYATIGVVQKPVAGRIDIHCIFISNRVRVCAELSGDQRIAESKRFFVA